ncbi:MAG TPA: SLBB domain-containing protein [Rhodothermales bacterium]|nr:SLBB domain-containing protein [Rhodothermales bacterium]
MCLLALLVFGAAKTAVAQTAPTLTSPAEIALTNPLEQLRQQLGTMRLAVKSLALEGAVDPSEYVLGPGDMFSVSVGGVSPILLDAWVSADGLLVIPGVASLPAAGKTLATVQQAAGAILRQQYRNVPTEIALVHTRQFYVHVSGAVPEPDRYLATPASRVSDVLNAAYAAALPYLRATNGKPAQGDDSGAAISVSSERPYLQGGYKPSLRTVKLIRGGEERSLDLFRYFTLGDTGSNPYVQDGDVIYVPAYHEQRDAFFVTGDVPYPGEFAFRPGDTAVDALTLAAGADGVKDIQEARLTRRTSNGSMETTLLDVPAMLAGTAPAEPLRPGDRLNVPIPVRATAAAYGEVEYPGTYPIEPGKTTLRELVQLAGGLKPDASIRTAYVERRKTLVIKGDAEASDLDFFSRAYLRSSMNNNHIVLDVSEALKPGAPDFFLQDGDGIVFPRDEGTVFVTGNVPNPGYVTFEEGHNAGYYIDKVGGFGPLATDVYVFASNPGEVKKGRGAPVKSGDTIFIDRQTVPDSPEMAQLAISRESSVRQSRIMTTQTIITGITAITSIITAYVAIFH